MSETMEKKLAEYREIARYGIAVGIGGGLLTEVLDHIDALAAQLATAQEQEKRWQQVCKEMCDDCDTECPPECDDYGHAPNCGQHSVPQALKNCRKELATANERVAELEASNTSKHTVMLASARALAAAERDAALMRQEMKRYLPIIERAESDTETWTLLTLGTGVATANGYRHALGGEGEQS